MGPGSGLASRSRENITIPCVTASIVCCVEFCKRRVGGYQDMNVTFLTNVETKEGSVTVLTKTRYLFFLSMPRTSVMPQEAGKLRCLGIQFHWKTSDSNVLEHLHHLMIQTLREVSLTDLRYVADMGKQLLSSGLPFVPEDAPLPACLKETSGYVKRVV